jgi:hypothetical protein
MYFPFEAGNHILASDHFSTQTVEFTIMGVLSPRNTMHQQRLAPVCRKHKS